MEDKNDENNENKNLVIRFVEFAFKVLNQEMDPFFEENLVYFDQNNEDLIDGRGETLQQYSIYQKYLTELEVYFDEFALQEGYQTSKECFDDINKLIIDDEIERKKLFQEMAERMLQTFNTLRSQIEDESDVKEIRDNDEEEENDNNEKKGSENKKSSSKSMNRTKESKSDSKDDDGEEEEEEERKADSKENNEVTVEVKETPAMAPPVIMFFQPVSLDSMIQHVLSLTEYTTFSYIIRTKLKQKQLYDSLQERVSKQGKNTTKRQRLLERGEHYEEIYEELIHRICDFTPNQLKFHEQIRAHLNTSQWKQLISTGYFLFVSCSTLYYLKFFHLLSHII